MRSATWQVEIDNKELDNMVIAVKTIENQNKLLAALISFTITSCFLSLVTYYLLLNHDVWWHLTAGKNLYLSGSLPESDTWSYTASSHKWYNLSWLWDIGAYIIYNNIGLENLVRLQIMLIALVFAWFTYFSNGFISSITVSSFALIAAFAYELPDVTLSLSPQTFSICMATLVIYILQKKYHITLIAIYILWLNLHGAFIVFFAILGSYGLSALLQKNYKEFFKLFIIGIACLAATLINPYGIGIVDGILSTVTHPAKEFVSEWGHFEFTKFYPATIYIIIAAMAVLITRQQELQPLKILCLICLVAGMDEKRHMVYFIIFSIPLLTMQICQFNKIKTLFLGNKLPYAVLPLAIMAHLTVWPAEFKIPENIYPVKEFEFIQNNLPPQKIYNDWNFGGYLIYASIGNYPIYIDGRAGTAYPDSLFTFDRSFSDEFDKMEAINREYGANIALIRRYPILERESETARNWKMLYRGQIAEVWQRIK